jgi:hypothetical protein
VPLIVEDGTGLPTADSYVDRTTAVARVTALYGAADPFVAATGDEQDADLRRAFRWIASEYRGRFKGQKLTRAQAGDYPREGATDGDGFEIASDEIPAELIDAQIEAARLLRGGTDLDGVLERGGAIKREKVGPLETEYADGATGETITPTLDGILAGLLDGGTSSMQVRLYRG